MSILLCLVNHLSTLKDECKEFEYKCRNSHDYLPTQQHLYWKEIELEVGKFDDFRNNQITIFHAQLLIIVLYIAFSRIFYELQKYFKGAKEEDPFLEILAE